MSARQHAVVWIDHDEARVLQFEATTASRVIIHSHVSVQRLHHRHNPDARAPEPVDSQFFDRIAGALDHAGGALITGPGQAKFEFEAYLRQHRPALAAMAHAVEMSAHPGDAALIAAARSRLPLEAGAQPSG